MAACVRSPICLARAWILVQACQASVGMDVDAKSCSIDAACVYESMVDPHPFQKSDEV